MPNTGFIICGTADQWDHDSDGGSNGFASPSGATADDGSFATTRDYSLGIASGSPLVLRCTNFDFSSIPPGATIDGFVVRLGDWYRSSGTIDIIDDLVQLIDENGALVGADQSTGSLVLLTGSQQNFDIGNGTSLFGWGSVDRTKLQDPSVGVAIQLVNSGFAHGSQIGSGDFVAINVYYSTTSTESLVPTRKPTRRTDIDLILLLEATR